MTYIPVLTALLAVVFAVYHMCKLDEKSTPSKNIYHGVKAIIFVLILT